MNLDKDKKDAYHYVIIKQLSIKDEDKSVEDIINGN